MRNVLGGEVIPGGVVSSPSQVVCRSCRCTGIGERQGREDSPGSGHGGRRTGGSGNGFIGIHFNLHFF